MRFRYTAALLALGAMFLAPGAAWAAEDEATARPAETVLPAICDYSAGECPIVFDPATDKCVISRQWIWVGREGQWTIMGWTVGDNPDLDAAVSVANDQWTQWIVKGDIASINDACGFKQPAEPETPAPQPDSEVPTDAGTDTPPSEPGSGGEGSEEPPPTGTPEPDGGDPNQTGLPLIPAECNQGDGRYVCPDGNPPYGCWAIEVNARVVGICIDPPIDQPDPAISLCEWEPTSCERVVESGPASVASGQPKPQKPKVVNKKAAGKRRAATKRKAAKNPAPRKSPKSGKRKPKASRR